MFKILSLLLLPSLAFANPIQACKEYLEGELWSYEYYPATKVVGDALFYGVYRYGESSMDRDSRLLSAVHEIFRMDFLTKKQSYIDRIEKPSSPDKEIAQVVTHWRNDIWDQWDEPLRAKGKACSEAPNRPSQLCYRHLEAYYPFLSYFEVALARLKALPAGTHANLNFLTVVSGDLAKGFYKHRYPIEDITSLFIHFEKTQRGSSGVIISGFEGKEGADLFKALLKSFKKMEIRKAKSAAGRVLRALRIRNSEIQSRLKYCIGNYERYPGDLI